MANTKWPNSPKKSKVFTSHILEIRVTPVVAPTATQEELHALTEKVRLAVAGCFTEGTQVVASLKSEVHALGQ